MGTKRMSQSVKHRLLKHQPSYRSRGRTGKTYPAFTLVELLIVIIVIAILAAITIVAYNGIQDMAKVSVMKNDLSQAAKAILAYKVSNPSENYPVNLSEAGVENSGGVSCTIQR